jgi:hypothetical protein
MKRFKVLRSAVTLGLLTLGLITAPKGAESRTSPSPGPKLSPSQQVEVSHALRAIDRSDIGACEAQRRFRAAMYRILTARQLQQLLISSKEPARRARSQRSEERAQATLRACQQTASSCTSAKRLVNVAAIDSAFEPGALARCSHRAPRQ